MKIMVFDVPASSGGALTILEQYHRRAIEAMSTKWIFVISTPKLSETSNTKVLNFPWAKKNWFYRIYFDCVVAPKLVNKYKPDEILSLQNVIIPRTKVKQTIYLHQPLTFAEKIYGGASKRIRRYILSKTTLVSLKKATKVIVQTIWMKEACINKGISEGKIYVESPEITDVVRGCYIRDCKSPCLFIYPAVPTAYKNHVVILKAAMLLKQGNIENYRIIFTLTGEENKLSRKLLKSVKENDLSIIFSGMLSKEDLFSYYRKAILLFPSFIESFGLPLLEAKLHNAPIITSDCAFSHEILDGYEKVDFFRYDDEKTLSELMGRYL